MKRRMMTITKTHRTYLYSSLFFFFPLLSLSLSLWSLFLFCSTTLTRLSLLRLALLPLLCVYFADCFGCTLGPPELTFSFCIFRPFRSIDSFSIALVRVVNRTTSTVGTAHTRYLDSCMHYFSQQGDRTQPAKVYDAITHTHTNAVN